MCFSKIEQDFIYVLLVIFVSLTVNHILKLFIESFLVLHEIQGFKYEKKENLRLPCTFLPSSNKGLALFYGHFYRPLSLYNLMSVRLWNFKDGGS